MRAMPEWKHHVLIEQTKTLREAPGKHLDILVAHHSMQPVAIETSVKKGDADKDAQARLGMHYADNGRKIQTAIAVELHGSDVRRSRLSKRHTLRYALHQHDRRFPKSGFMHGNTHDLARLVAATAATKEGMEKAAEFVAGNVVAAANILEPKIKLQDLVKIRRTLYQRSALTGLRTTMVLWLNALLVQQRLRGGAHDIPGMTSTPSKCSEAWHIIHGINWRAVFEPAIAILDHAGKIAPAQVSEALGLLIKAVEHIETARLGSDINIGAELFPKIAEDRKESAAFYTQPATAELLAALTIQYGMADWSDDGVFQRFRIADITCGTGTLLRFAYRQVRTYHMSAKRATDKSMRRLHRDAMEHGLRGTDVSPIAAHLTSTSLAVETKQRYDDAHVGWVPVGNENRTGAIEYIEKDTIEDLMMDVGVSAGSGARASYSSITVKARSVDVVLMNPPYSRTRGGQRAFDIAGLTDKERKACQKRWGNLIKDEPCIKTAGMAATFLCIARKKVKPGGRIGFVLPRTAAFADTWERTRAMVELDFEDITVVAVSSGRALGREALSADTMMEEMLLVATRKGVDDGKHSPIKCATLHEPVTRLGEAAVIAEAIRDTTAGPIVIGGEIGVARTFQSDSGRPWSYVGTIHDTVAVIANDLAAGRLRDLEGNNACDIPMTTVGGLFTVGPTHHLIRHGGSTTGAFILHEVTSDTDAVGTYRSLWGADAKVQTSLVVSPTHKGTPHTDKADDIWEARSTLFYSRGMRWNTQCVVAVTTRQAAMGGRAWTSLHHDDIRVMKAFALWANSIYGMMVHWTRGQRTHSGRSSLQVRAIGKMPCPDFGQFGDAILDDAAVEFDRLSELNLLPAYMATEDETRAGIDDAVSEMLNVPGYDTDALVSLWCAEPSVRGLKK